MKITNVTGITMIEVVMVIVITAIILTVAMKSVVTVTETGRIEETKQEMEQLAMAIVGNPELENNGVRTDYGYVGDVGSLPAGLDSLYNRPSGYTTWNGPYIQRRFAQITNDFKEDAWGEAYTYSGGVDIVSSGSGSDIVRKLANTTDDLVSNEVTGIILDRNGAPPGPIEVDSVELHLTIPDGTGGTTTLSMHPEASGYFSFESIPIGNHDLEIIYEPLHDTLKRFVSVLPNSVLYQEYFLTFSPWSEIPPSEECFGYVEGTASLIMGSSVCDRIEFDIVNNCSEHVYVTSIMLEWDSPEAYFQNVQWDNQAAYNKSTSGVGSGEVAEFQAPNDTKWAESGETITVHVEIFKTGRQPSSASVDMSNVDITVTLSDGTTFSFNTGPCL